MKYIKLLTLSLFGIYLSGCGILLGNVKPIDEKSDSYQLSDFEDEHPNWIALKQEELSDRGELATHEISDLAYQSNLTSNILSLNSACREDLGPTSNSGSELRRFTDLLIMGIVRPKEREESRVVINGLPALQTTLLGTMSDQDVKVRTVVLRHRQCVYDLMYVARPDSFARESKDFDKFIASFQFDR